MKRKMHLLLVLAGLTLGYASDVAGAAEIPQQAFQAEYVLTGPGGMSIHKIACDGKGHGRSEIISPSRRSVSIADYANKQVNICTPGLGTLSVPLDDKMMDSMNAFNKNMKANSKPLGSKLIDGHMCTGTHYDLDAGYEELWTGNDIGGARVYSKVEMPNYGVTEAHLKSFSRVAPGPEMFVLPNR